MPLNTKQLTRGMLNYTFFQHYPGWKRPFWAVKQYDPESNSFIPRSHLGVSVNVTHRNWTAIGNLNCDIEPIVDPCGSVIPFVDGWSLECWIKFKDQLIIPAYCKNIEQKLIDDLPIVETILIEEKFILRMIHYTFNDNLVCKYEILNSKHKTNLTPELGSDLELILATRPFNYEGVSPINAIQYYKNENLFLINNEQKLKLNVKPENIILSNLQFGDTANLLFDSDKRIITNKIICENGFANALAVFHSSDIKQGLSKFECVINLNNKSGNDFITPSLQSVQNHWHNLLSKGSQICLPDERISSIVKSSLSTSLQFLDKDKVTPGASIYHQFWFRDAAFQLNVLDKYGYTELTKNIIINFFSYQKSNGYFQSQKGEWDSNGQVLWLVFQHTLLSKDLSIIKKNFSSLNKAVKWIDKNRLNDKKYSSEKYYGLLPKGLSAEHLGLADNYYWDNFWAIAGIKSFILICDLLGETNPKYYEKKLLEEFEKTINNSIKESVQSNHLSVLPSAPSKALDSGMMGSLIAIYPLQILDWDNEKFIRSLDYVHKNYFKKNLFFSGYNSLRWKSIYNIANCSFLSFTRQA